MKESLKSRGTRWMFNLFPCCRRTGVAQTRIIDVLGDQAIVQRVSVRYVASLLRRRRLYDYERGEWTDFSGRVTGQDRTPLGIARHAS